MSETVVSEVVSDAVERAMACRRRFAAAVADLAVVEREQLAAKAEQLAASAEYQEALRALQAAIEADAPKTSCTEGCNHGFHFAPCPIAEEICEGLEWERGA